MSEDRVFVGIDLGGTQIKSVVVSAGGRVLARNQVPTQARDGRDAVLCRMDDLFDWARRHATDHQIKAAGVAIPGVLNMETGQVELLTNVTPDWNGFMLRDELARRTGFQIALMNDVRAATLGEHVWGAGRPFSHFVCVAIGTGVGGGLVLDGRLFMGSRNAGGEIGHMTVLPEGYRCNCGNLGCLETVLSAPSLSREAKNAIDQGDAELARLAQSSEPSAREIALAAARGSATAQRIYAEAGRLLGMALGNLVAVLNPQAVIIGGGVAMAGDLLLDPVRREIERRTMVFTKERGGVEVLVGALGSHAGAIGAAAWAMQLVEGE